MRSPRILAFVALVGVCLALAVGVVVVAATSGDSKGSPLGTLPRAPFLLARTAGGPADGELLARSLVGGEAEKLGLACARVHYAAGRGLCVVYDASFPVGYKARVFGSDLEVTHSFAIEGFPSRVRVSRDGLRGAVTTFVAGHSYADKNFSTRTLLLDLESGRELGQLEDFAFKRDGHPVTAVDRNFWGVTFAPGGDRFYATLATRGETYLVEGSISRRTGRTLRRNVECPSLSPDATRVAYKRRVGGAGEWRFHVLDLRTGADVELAESASRDDQIEWLDDTRVLYGAEQAVWVMPADGSGAPTPFLSGADSPAVVRA